MTIDEAIVVNKGYLERYGKGMLSTERDAQKLGIEALKYVRGRPETWSDWNPDVLLGETKEQNRR